MAKKGQPSPRAASTPEDEKRKDGVLHGLMVCALGSIWLAQELGVISTGIPAGPITIMVIGLAMVMAQLKK